MHYRAAFLLALVMFLFISMVSISAGHEEETGEEILQSSPLPPVQQPATPSAEVPPAPLEAAPEAPKIVEEKPAEEMAKPERPSPEELKKIKGSFTLNTTKQKGYFGAVSLTVLFFVLVILLIILL